MNLHKKMIFSSVALIFVGVLGMVPYADMWLGQRDALATGRPTVVASRQLSAKPSLVTGKPTQMTVPSLGIALDIADGEYNPGTGEWTLSKDKAHYALPTYQPNNEKGNTLIYGHNRREVFAVLERVSTGEKAHILTDNGYRFTYTYISSEAVDPTDTSVFAYQGAPRLTLQTCSGAWYQNRQFYYFAYSGYEKL